jgi:hypothetical protein
LFTISILFPSINPITREAVTRCLRQHIWRLSTTLQPRRLIVTRAADVCKRMLGHGVRGWQSKSQPDGSFDRREVISAQSFKRANQLGVRNRYRVLSIEDALPQERDRDRRFEFG